MGHRKHQEWPEGISWADDSGTYLVFVQVKETASECKEQQARRGIKSLGLLWEVWWVLGTTTH
jgi:hypothetical protein